MKDLITQAHENIKRSVEEPLERIADLEKEIVLLNEAIEQAESYIGDESAGSMSFWNALDDLETYRAARSIKEKELGG